MARPAWDVTVTYDYPLPAGEQLTAILQALPAGAAVGRSPWADHLAVSVLVHADTAQRAADLGQAFAEHAAEPLELGSPVGIEVLTPDETERRSATAEAPTEYLSVSAAADLLNLTAAAVRLRAQKGQHGAVKIGSEWALRKDLVEAAARTSGSSS